MNLPYLLPRLARRFLPEKLTRFLLRRGWIIHPGIESSNPEGAVKQYCEVLHIQGRKLEGQRVLVFGYGGRFDIGIELLRAGARHVVLCDKFAPPDHHHNLDLLPAAQDYLLVNRGQVLPRSEVITLYQGDIRDAARGRTFLPVNLVFSSSVYEHLAAEEMEEITSALCSLTTPGGFHIHFVDLRDHFFKYPFEMLTFTSKNWRRWLNPTSNLNRWRLTDYQRLFDMYFTAVEITVLASDPVAFERVRGRIKPEFLAVDSQLQAVTLIRVNAVV